MKSEHLSQLPKAENKWISSSAKLTFNYLCVYIVINCLTEKLFKALFSSPAQMVSQQPSPASWQSGTSATDQAAAFKTPPNKPGTCAGQAPLHTF